MGTAVKYETLSWDVSPAAAYVRAAQQQQGSYKAAISATIADLTVNLPSDVLADAGDASREVTRFDAELGGEIAPFSSVLLRTESAASSNIENLTASARAIAEAELPGAKTTSNAKVIVANTAAMVAAINLADTIDSDAILAMHTALMRDVDPKSAGRWREEQVWIGGGAHGPRGAIFVPPHHSRVVAAIDDLLRFTRRDDIPALAQIAVAHAQFETIHPFADGNGRTGRALIQAMLRRKGLTRNVTVPVSAGLLTDTNSYFTALTAYREGDPAPIVRRVSEAAVAAVFNARALVGELHVVRAEWNDKITARSDSAVWRIADLLLRRPVISTALLAEELDIDSKHARRYLEPLSEAGIIIETSSGPRSRVWRSPAVIAALDAFAERARRGGLGR
jgi:Fic family protein